MANLMKFSRLDVFYPCVKDYKNEIFKNIQGVDQIVFSFHSQFRFGRYSPPKNAYYRGTVDGSILADVWKFDPTYVKWLILNASGVAIKPSTLVDLFDQPVFNLEDLSDFIIVEEKTDVYHLNFKNFSKKGNFKFHEKVRETLFEISDYEKERLLKINLQKIEGTLLDCSHAQRGSTDWSTNVPIGLKPQKNILLR